MKKKLVKQTIQEDVKELDLKKGDIIYKEEKLQEASEGFSIVWVTSNYSVMKSGIKSIRDFERAIQDVKKEMKDQANTDDFWIDDIWYDGRKLPDVDWKEILSQGQGIDQELFELVLDDPDIAIKMEFLKSYGYSINEETLDGVGVYDAGSENWIEGNWKVRFPENWLYDEFEKRFSREKFVMEHYSYFEEGIARLFSDDKPNGVAYYDKINTYNL